MRACDHQLQPAYVLGRYQEKSKYPDFLISAENQVIPAKDYMSACEEVLKDRKK